MPFSCDSGEEARVPSERKVVGADGQNGSCQAGEERISDVRAPGSTVWPRRPGTSEAMRIGSGMTS
ncbi:hypothetical protein C8Q79DRAFT_602547 [Trametes meyenii]|nr:hypothetical protein C8Q79DRAFT_602547 [Trametes meyenii]